MRVKLAKHFTDHTCRLFMRFACLQTKLVHAEQYPSMNGLQTVPNIWQRTTDNDRH